MDKNSRDPVHCWLVLGKAFQAAAKYLYAPIGVCRTQDEGKQVIEIREHEDLILATARRLVKKAIKDLMRTHHIDRRTAQGWIKETVG